MQTDVVTARQKVLSAEVAVAKRQAEIAAVMGDLLDRLGLKVASSGEVRSAR
jgi:hypothetical protein